MFKKILLLGLLMTTSLLYAGAAYVTDCRGGTYAYYTDSDSSGASAESGGESSTGDSDTSASTQVDSGMAEEIKMAQERAAASEEAMNEASSIFGKVNNKLVSIKNKLEVKELSEATKKALLSEKEVYQKEVDAAYAVCKEKADAMCEAYIDLGKVYEKYNYSGDPVLISTGQYVAEYTDFIAQDFLDTFIVSRKLTSPSVCESFGKGWTCSLDSRIIRCNMGDFGDLSSMIEDCISSMDEFIQCYEDYQERDLIMSVFYGAVSLNDVKELIENKVILEGTLEFIEEESFIRNQLRDKNIYAAYGRYSNQNSYSGGEETLIYLDEDGNETPFKYEGNGIWQSMGKLSAARFYLQGLDSNGNFSNTSNTDGGYQIIYQTGRKKIYSAYGILECEIDQNGNKTLYKSQNGRINQIVLKTGEIISVSRNSDGKISCVQGPVSGKTSYIYQGDFLLSTVKNDGVPLVYSYNENSMLEKITKADNSFLLLSYDFNSQLNDYVCSSVANEKDDVEYFYYDFNERKTIHKTVEGRDEIFLYDELGSPVYFMDEYGNESIFERDEYGLIKTFTENGVSRNFVYDSLFRPVQLIDDDGAVQRLEYNDKGQLTALLDADGFSFSYEYDERGNLISEYFENTKILSASYYPNGLMKNSWEEDISRDYEYNAFGSLVKEVQNLPSYGSLEKVLDYDSRNRLVYCKDYDGSVTNISYDTNQNKRIENINGRLWVERFFDAKNREIKVQSRDLETGKTYTKEIIYDGHGNVLKTLINGEIYEERNYSPSDVLLDKTVWNLTGQMECASNLSKQGIQTSYVYNSSGFLESEINSTVEADSASSSLSSLLPGQIVCKMFDYKKSAGKTLVTCKNYDGTIRTYEFDKYGRLVNEIYEDGFTKSWSYSKGGRVKVEKDSSNNLLTYFYRNDGSYYVSGRKNALAFTQEYDSYGRLISIRDFSGNLFESFYDENGRKIKESGPGYEVINQYDIYGRILSSKTFDNEGKICRSYSVFYDGNSMALYHNENKYQEIVLDVWNRPVETLDKKGRKFYSYDALSNPVRILYGNGNEILNEYNGAGRLAFSKDSGGQILSFLYDSRGQLENSYLNSDAGRKEFYSAERNFDDRSLLCRDFYGVVTKTLCDEQGRLTYLENQKTGTYQFFYNDNCLIRVDEEGNEYKYEYDSYGRLVREIDNLGKEITYEYDAFDRLLKKVDFNGRTFLYQYDDESFSSLIKSDSGNVFEIVRNPLGQIIALKSDDCDYKYEYDEAGNLLLFKDDKAQIEIEYFYDDLGRCVEKKSNSFDFVFSYDSVGSISKICDLNKGVWVVFEYDLNGNESKRAYSNGNEIVSGYDSMGLLTFRETRDSIGQIVSSQKLERDSVGRIVCIRDKNDREILFSYDEKGRLSHSLYPYDDSLLDYYFDEAKACGLYIKEKPDYLTEWETFFEYDSQGNIAAVKNPLGKICYEYDSMNRLISKYGENSKTNGMKFVWDDNGNLIEIKSNEFAMNFEYGSLNRPEKIISRNYLDSTYDCLSFSYDPLGRRIREIKNNGESKAYVYDGLSLDVIQTIPLLMNESAITNYVSSSVLNDQSLESVRWIDDSSFVAAESVRSMDLDSYKSDLQVIVDDVCESRPFSVISKDGLPCAYLYSDLGFDESVKVEYLIPDYRNNIIAVSDTSSGLRYKNTCDVWGNVVSNGKNFSYSYSQSKVDSCMQLLNLGFRDYCPAMKSFISQDPVRDGENWFAFCAGDPLNYFDGNGLEVAVIKQYYNMSDYEKKLVVLGNYYGPGYVSLENGRTKETIYLNEQGCYVTTFANIAKSINEDSGKTVVDPKYTDPLSINKDKSLFWENSACLNRNVAMDKVFGEGNWDYWTAQNSSTQMLRAQMVKYSVLQGDHYYMGVFNLSEATKCAVNHMVGINDLFDENGYLDNNSDIACTSSGDRTRIYENGKLETYRLENLKELRVIGLKNSSCGE